MLVHDWLEFFEEVIPRWWTQSPGSGFSPLSKWFLWTESREVDLEDPASLSYPPGEMNEYFFRMVLDQQYGRGPVDPFKRIYEKVRAIGDLRDVEASLCMVDVLNRLGKEGKGYWRFQRIPQDLIKNVRLVIERSRSSSFEKYLHHAIGQILGTKRFVFPEIRLPEGGARTFAQEIVRVLLTPKFKLRSVGENMASYGLRHLAQIPGADRLIKADYHNLRLGTREEVERTLDRWSADLVGKYASNYTDAPRMFSPAVLNMAVFVQGFLNGRVNGARLQTHKMDNKGLEIDARQTPQGSLSMSLAKKVRNASEKPIIDLEHIDVIVTHFRGEEFSTPEFADAFKRTFPDDWQVLRDNYGPGGAKGGSYYSPNSYLAQQLRRRVKRGELKFVGWTEAPPDWGNEIVAAWQA